MDELKKRIEAIRGKMAVEKPVEKVMTTSLTIGWIIYNGPQALEVKGTAIGVEVALRLWKLIYPDMQLRVEPVLGIIGREK